MEIRYATAEDVRRHYQNSGGVPPSNRMRVITAEHGGKIMGLAGVYYQGKSVVAFSDLSEEMKSHKKDIVRVTRMVMAMIKELNIPVFALCTDDNGKKFCKKLGFVGCQKTDLGDIMICHS